MRLFSHCLLNYKGLLVLAVQLDTSYLDSTAIGLKTKEGVVLVVEKRVTSFAAHPIIYSWFRPCKLATSSIGSIVNGSGSTSGKELVVSVNADGAIAPLELKTIPAQPSDSSVPSENSGSEVKEGPTRCNTCKKRVGLTGFNCRCGNVLCVMHTIRTSMTANLITGQLLGMQLPRPTLSSRLRSLTKSRDEREDYSSPDSTPLFSIYVLLVFSSHVDYLSLLVSFIDINGGGIMMMAVGIFAASKNSLSC